MKETRRTPAYRTVAEALRKAVVERAGAADQRLPTEAELSQEYGVSRHTVRRAYQELLADGIIYRVPGRGTFPAEPSPYLRSTGSVEDLMALARDTEFSVVSPLEPVEDPEAALRLGLEFDEVMQGSYVRTYNGLPFCHATVALPPELGARMRDTGFMVEVGPQVNEGLLALIDQYAEQPINAAKQTTNAVEAPEAVGPLIDLEPGRPCLWIEQLFFDVAGRPVGLARNYFNPERYAYRLRLRRTAR